MAEEYGGFTGTFPGFGGSSGTGGKIFGLGPGELGGLAGDLFGFFSDDNNNPTDNSNEFDKRLLSIIDSAGGFLGDSQNKYNKESAIGDAQGIVSNIFRDYKNTALPQIFNAQNSAGGYGSSTGQLLANDAFGAATAKSADAVLKNITDYRKIQQQDYGALAELFKGKSARPTPKAANAKGGDDSDFFGDIIGTAAKFLPFIL
jgi:hypothetical protein